MIEVEMNEDIRKFEPKFIGPLTQRQTICAGLGVVFGIIVAIVISKIFGITDLMTIFMIGAISAMPVFMCGWGKMYGLPFEIYFSRFIYRLICPRIRKYKSTTYRDELKKIRKQKEQEKIKKMSKKEQKQYQKKKKKVTYSKKTEYKIYR